MTSPTPEWVDDIPAVKSKPRPPPPTTMGCLIVSLLSLAILLASLVLGIQTRVGCDLVADFLRRETGLDLAVGGASLALPMDLYLTDVQTKPSTTPLGSFKAREIRLGWRWGGELDLSVQGGRLEIMKIADGWVPVPFARIGTLTDVRDTVTLLGKDFPLASLDVRDSAIIWNGPDGERQMSVEGFGMAMKPVILGDRKLLVLQVTARTVRRAEGVKGLNIRRLWLSGSVNSYMEVEYGGIWEGDVSTLRDWWSNPPGKGNSPKGMGYEK